MDISNKTQRAILKGYFVKNAIPTQRNFAELIDACLNQGEDGIAKISGEPLNLESAPSGLQTIMNFYKDFAHTKPAWTISLNPRANLSDPGSAQPGWSVGDADGASKLFIDETSGNVGIGTTSPSAKLHVSGSTTLDGTTSVTGNLTVAGTSTLTGNVGIGTPDPKRTLDVKGQITFNGNRVNPNSPNGLFWHGSDNYGIYRESGEWVAPYPALRIAFQTGVSIGAGSGHGGTRIYDGAEMNNLIASFGDGVTGGAGRYNTYLKGNVGIGTTNPLAKLSINGGLHVGGDADPGDNNLLVAGTSILIGNVGIGLAPAGSLDVARGTESGGTALFRGTDRVSHFNYSTPEHTYIRGGKTSSHVFINDNGGNVGIGTTNPLAKLSINGGLHVGGNSDPGHKNLLVDGTFKVDGAATLNGTVNIAGDISTDAIAQITPFAVRGVGHNNGGSPYVKLGGQTIYSGTGRGLTLTVINKANHLPVADSTAYDTHDSISATDLLATAMLAVTVDQIGIIVSSDSWCRGAESSSSLKEAFAQLGLYQALNGAQSAANRMPYVAIFEVDVSGVGRAAEVFASNGASAPYAELRGWLLDGSFVTEGNPSNALVGVNANGHRQLGVFTNHDGNVGIGTTTPAAKLDVNGTLKVTAAAFFGPDPSGKYLQIGGDAKDAYKERSVLAVEAGNLHLDSKKNQNLYLNYHNKAGNVYSNKSIGVLSDRKLKTNINTEKGILERLLQLDVKNYQWKNRADKGTKDIGFIAQDVQPLFPELVSSIADPDTKEFTLALKYDNFGVLAVGGLKELQAETKTIIDGLQTRIEKLETLLAQ
ncbi:MAG: hypothetical protein ACI9A2_003220 [Halioglobus sp.]|jgi:hypothetical protein